MVVLAMSTPGLPAPHLQPYQTAQLQHACRLPLWLLPCPPGGSDLTNSRTLNPARHSMHGLQMAESRRCAGCGADAAAGHAALRPDVTRQPGSAARAFRSTQPAAGGCPGRCGQHARRALHRTPGRPRMRLQLFCSLSVSAERAHLVCHAYMPQAQHGVIALPNGLHWPGHPVSGIQSRCAGQHQSMQARPISAAVHAR